MKALRRNLHPGRKPFSNLRLVQVPHLLPSTINSINHHQRFYCSKLQDIQQHGSGNELIDNFSNNVNERGHQNAFVLDEHHVTLEQLYQSSLQCAIYLREKFDIKPGDVISCVSSCGANPQAQVVMIATHILNAVFMPLNVNSTIQIMQEIIKETNSKLFVCDEVFYTLKYPEFNFNEETASPPPPILVYKGIENGIQWIGDEWMKNTSIQSMQNTVYDIMDSHRWQYSDSQNITALLPTSGTTGRPKLVTHSTQTVINWLAGFRKIGDDFFDSSLLEIWNGTAAKTTKAMLNSAPHNLGWYVAMANPMTTTPHCYYYPTKIMLDSNSTSHEKGKDLLRLIEDSKLNIVALGVSQVYELVKMQKSFGSHIDVIITGGDIVHPAMVQKLMKLLPKGTPMMNGYGATECGAIAVNMWPCDDKQDMDEIKYNLLSLKTLKFVDGLRVDSESDILEVKTDSLMLGYYNNAAKNAEVFTEDGYYRTGDVLEEVKYDETSRLSAFRIVARNVDFIITETAHIQPQNIENVLLSHDKINGAGAVGVPCNIIFSEDEKMRNVEYKYPVAFVTVNQENKDDKNNEKLIDELLQLCNAKLSKQKNEIPYKIFIVNDIPTNTMGKILRRELADTAISYFTQK